MAGDVIFPVMTTENERITAETIVHTNCPQNPRLPNLLKYLDVFSNLFATYTIKATYFIIWLAIMIVMQSRNLYKNSHKTSLFNSKVVTTKA